MNQSSERRSALIERALANGSEILPTDAWRLVQEDERARIVDVRTDVEWLYVGSPDLGDVAAARYLRISWQTFPGLRRNPAFEAELAAVAGPKTILMFICRSGARSLAAAHAAAAAGFSYAVSVKDGFEGPLDAEGHRGRMAGWKYRDLPWRQSSASDPKVDSGFGINPMRNQKRSEIIGPDPISGPMI